jgi:ribosomal protein S10
MISFKRIEKEKIKLDELQKSELEKLIADLNKHIEETNAAIQNPLSNWQEKKKNILSNLLALKKTLEKYENIPHLKNIALQLAVRVQECINHLREGYYLTAQEFINSFKTTFLSKANILIEGVQEEIRYIDQIETLERRMFYGNSPFF